MIQRSGATERGQTVKVSKRFVDRARPALRRYKKILDSAKRRDVNESDTSVIVNDMLTDILGYDKYSDITTEFAVRSTFCDLAIKCDGRLQYLIEVKPVGADLKELYLRQAIEYGAREGIEWVILTNGISWQAHRIRFEQPVDHDLVFEVNLLDESAKPNEALEKFYLISREAGTCTALEHFWQRREATSRYVVAQLLLEDKTLTALRRNLRSLFKGTKVSTAEIREVLETEVIKRDALEGDRAEGAAKSMRRATRKRARDSEEKVLPAKKEPVRGTAPVAGNQPASNAPPIG
jgi:hypothetical protein